MLATNDAGTPGLKVSMISVDEPSGAATGSPEADTAPDGGSSKVSTKVRSAEAILTASIGKDDLPALGIGYGKQGSPYYKRGLVNGESAHDIDISENSKGSRSPHNSESRAGSAPKYDDRKHRDEAGRYMSGDIRIKRILYYAGVVQFVVLMNFCVAIITCLIKTDFQTALGAICPLSFTGFYGARRFRIDALFCYIVYLALELGLRMAAVFSYDYNLHEGSDSILTKDNKLIAIVFFVIISLYAYLVVMKLSDYIKQFNPTTLLSLRGGQYEKKRKYRT